MIIDQYTDEAGFIRIVWEAELGRSYVYKFEEEPTEDDLIRLGEASVLTDIIQETLPIRFSDSIRPDLAQLFAEKCREVPTLTSSQYNTWLAAMTWNDEAFLRFFVSEFAKELSIRGNVSLSGATENAHMQAARDYINAVLPAIFNRLIGL